MKKKSSQVKMEEKKFVSVDAKWYIDSSINSRTNNIYYIICIVNNKLECYVPQYLPPTHGSMV